MADSDGRPSSDDDLGRILASRDHGVIRRWAEARGAVPATVEGSVQTDHLAVLRLAFPGAGSDLQEVTWEEWFRAFDARGLDFVYQETRSDGGPSSYFRLEDPGGS